MHYKDHLETHTTEKKYQCPKCGKNYKTSSSLRGHLRRHIVKPVIIPKFECTICHKKVMTRAYLIYHEKSHNGNLILPSSFSLELASKIDIFS